MVTSIEERQDIEQKDTTITRNDEKDEEKRYMLSINIVKGLH